MSNNNRSKLKRRHPKDDLLKRQRAKIAGANIAQVNKERKEGKKPKPIGRPPLSETTKLTPQMERYCYLVAQGVPMFEIREELGISDYVARRWKKDVPLIKETINAQADDSQIVVAMSFMENKLQDYGGSATLWMLAHALELKDALHQFMITKIGKGEIPWSYAVELATQCEEKFGVLVPKGQKQTREVETTTLDLLKNIEGGKELVAGLEPAKVVKQTIRETREDK